MTPYKIILHDLTSNLIGQHPLKKPPYDENADMKTKVQVTHRYLLRAQRLKQRRSALIFAYFLGRLIESRELTKKEVKEMVSEHFYILAVRTFYIFEVTPAQIYATQTTSVNYIRRLKQEEVMKLALEI